MIFLPLHLTTSLIYNTCFYSYIISRKNYNAYWKAKKKNKTKNKELKHLKQMQQAYYNEQREKRKKSLEWKEGEPFLDYKNPVADGVELRN